MSVKAVTRFTAVFALASAAFAGSASAQGWQAMPATFGNTPQTTASSRPFFDNASYDGDGCNIGFILSNAAGASTTCKNQIPAAWLPFAGTAPTFYYGSGNNAANFMFSGGTYTIDVIYQTPKTVGRVEGTPTTWGMFQGAVDTNLGGAGALPFTFSTAAAWGLFIDLTDSGLSRARSNANARQFAVFGFGSSSATASGGLITPVSGAIQTFYVGLEDQGCASVNSDTGCTVASDYDNNDVIFRVRSVPEPSTYLLMASGLVGLAVMARRRRSA